MDKGGIRKVEFNGISSVNGWWEKGWNCLVFWLALPRKRSFKAVTPFPKRCANFGTERKGRGNRRDAGTQRKRLFFSAPFAPLRLCGFPKNAGLFPTPSANGEPLSRESGSRQLPLQTPPSGRTGGGGIRSSSHTSSLSITTHATCAAHAQNISWRPFQRFAWAISFPFPQLGSRGRSAVSVGTTVFPDPRPRPGLPSRPKIASAGSAPPDPPAAGTVNHRRI